ncbi:MAG: hypothetical protein GY807_20420, partial [Gammaproteobacteria bacterium]|nr:hypothetical protein [Gammaproteobacteria bacterium]
MATDKKPTSNTTVQALRAVDAAELNEPPSVSEQFCTDTDAMRRRHTLAMENAEAEARVAEEHAREALGRAQAARKLVYENQEAIKRLDTMRCWP